MIRFTDYYQNEVILSFQDHPFSSSPMHVWIICQYNNQWLLTNHRDRGFEFPGGKVEKGETPLEAAKREVFEETGGIIQRIEYLGQYKVLGKEKTIIKNIYVADIKEIKKKKNYYETKGPVLFDRLPKDIQHDSRFSFIMKDGVLLYSLKKIEERNDIFSSS
ncbi:RNA deprotection pyrophosphohydrolase [Bacillus alveayuensis]|jgi:8-oxo-dGTP diphosphatase|uniref:8-oxo-dGTP diphosphatase n=1 Tax=Aeribacillus alveayuensis TaxID=279215 RepID=A0ABT9VJ11_9BACI|nr:nucleoside triphosphatase YtkD [Bacillus alveayuensis]MDQ0160949.1 8-oxo-dGTP diphosphatase [Bacillus alveayuensis]